MVKLAICWSWWAPRVQRRRCLWLGIGPREGRRLLICGCGSLTFLLLRLHFCALSLPSLGTGGGDFLPSPLLLFSITYRVLSHFDPRYFERVHRLTELPHALRIGQGQKILGRSLFFFFSSLIFNLGGCTASSNWSSTSLKIFLILSAMHVRFSLP